MKLTAKRKHEIVVAFKLGARIKDISYAYDQTPERIEGLIRDWMVTLDKLEKIDSPIERTPAQAGALNT